MLEQTGEFAWILTLLSTLVLTLELAAFFSAIHALRHVRTAQATVGWTVGLLTLPLLTLPLYWIFARNRFEGYREAIREIGKEHRDSILAVQNELQTKPYSKSTRQHSALEVLADTLDTPISEADRCELLIDGFAFFEKAFHEISQAQHYVYASFYILRDDELGQRFADSLIERAKNGVTVRVVYDEVGSLRLSPHFLTKLIDAGIDIRPFHTRQGWINRFQINFRNHRKLILVDGKSALVGGLNVGNEYLGEHANLPAWRDTGILVQGHVTRKLQAVFAGDYYWAARADLPEADWTATTTDQSHLGTKTEADQHPSNQGNVAVCATGPSDQRPRAGMMFSAAAGSAKNRLWICTPYLIPDEATLLALHMARARGVDVRILIPNQADQWAVYLAGFHYAKLLTDAGIQVLRYTRGFMHQKCVLIDEDLALIGSTNLDQRSLHLNFELMLAVEESNTVKAVAEMMKEDLNHAVEDTTPKWWLTNLGTALARLFSPIL